MDPDGPSTVCVTIAAGWRSRLRQPERLCRQAIEATLRRAANAPWRPRAEISVLLSDDATVRRLNAAWRGIDRATNVLSFPALDHLPPHAPSGPLLLGDIVLALETVLAEAEAEGKPLNQHVSHLVVHGCLHLLGHDHHEAACAERMEALERLILAELGIADPYADRRLHRASRRAGPPAQEALR